MLNTVKKKFLLIKNNIEVIDKFGNILNAQRLEYDLEKNFKKYRKYSIKTKNGYSIQTKNIILDNINKIVQSNFDTNILDNENNKIFLKNFEYLNNQNIIKSIGFIKIIDNKDNNYEFSQIYIDQNKKEIVGTDIKAYLNSEQFKVNEKKSQEYLLIRLVLIIKNNFQKIAFSLYVIIERAISVHHGRCSHQKFYTMLKKNIIL